MASDSVFYEAATTLVEVPVPNGRFLILPTDASALVARLRTQYGVGALAHLSGSPMRLLAALRQNPAALSQLRRMLVQRHILGAPNSGDRDVETFVRNDVTSPWLHRLTVFFLPQNTLAAPPTGARPQAVPVARPAAPGKPVSAMSMGERIFAMFVRMQEFLPGAAKKQLAQTIASLASPEAQLTLVACLTFLAVSQAAGVGEVADALLLSWAYATLGWSGLCAMYRLLGAVVDAATAQDDAALTAAARSFAANLTTLGTDVLLVFVTWAARRAGKGEAAEKDPAAADPARRPARGVKPATPVRDPTLRSSLSDDWFDSSGNVRWPPNRGFAGDPVAETLQPGTIIDRYGEDAGRYFSPAGTSYAARALPYDPAQMNYTQFEVLKPLPVEAGPAEAWFDQAGGGTQYFSKMNAQQLLDEGYIRKVSP